MSDTKSTMFYSLEKAMYDAFSIGDSSKFTELVRPDALMVCGGMRETGEVYTQIVSGVRLQSFEISDFIIHEIDNSNVLTNYVVTIDCRDPMLSGSFRVSSLWNCIDGTWKIVFNQDSRLA
ncbi:MAG TPA: nuclear transport factor 2 family protein [Treponemataceae bacterium]|nr:nuclear transport factor 2 family protein [Treponemataceae bacterium]HQL05634.1 nuclear transport factor 2 family protein [Treponemataceae bacterium]